MKHFKDYQLHAFRESFRLAILLAAAIAATILLSGAAATYAISVQLYFEQFGRTNPSSFYIATFAVSSCVAALVVLAGTAWKLFELREGGPRIAEQLGGERLIEPRDLEEQTIKNIVEELAIASASPVPSIYILQGDQSINAFAAGYSKENAVIGITRGAIKHLSRDQLQGVVAHEYSHIINGDMRLNMHMISWLHGLLAITLCAEFLVYEGYDSIADSNSKMRNPLKSVAIMLLGICLWPVGIVGWFASLLVKAAMNRQREYLADAFAVEFTRYPHALADALKRLLAHDHGTKLRSHHATEVSHMLLVEGCGWLNGLLASHPPLQDRIKRLDPNWDGIPKFADEDHAVSLEAAFQSSPKHGAVQSLATLTDDYANQVTQAIPTLLLEIIQASGGPALIFESLLSTKSASRKAADEFSKQAARIQQIAPIIEQLSEAQQLALFDATVDRVRQDASERSTVCEVLDRWQQANQDDSLFYFMASHVLAELIKPQAEIRPQYGKLKDVMSAYVIILSKMAHAGGSKAVAGYAFQRGLARTGLGVSLVDEEYLTWDVLAEALEICRLLAPQPKQELLDSIASVIATDRWINEEEALLVRTVCSALAVSGQHVLPGQPISVANES